MGQAFSLATPTAGSAGIDVPEMVDFMYEKSMGNAQFMKSIRARHSEGVVLVKALVKPYTPMSLEKYSSEIIRQRKALADVPNVLAFQRVIETETNGYLVRPFLHSSLYDRMSTRPFLEDIDKKWLAFQLLCALRDCHARDIYHGDIKAQNVLVTSWNWVYLTDFSSAYKPVVLPDDNPADFSYFFDTAGKRTCYIAPERFIPAGASQQQQDDCKLTWAMDVFSAGCLIAQLFLETELFTLSQLYKYRRGEYDPTVTALSVIADKEVREMIAHMIQLDPESRYTADQYLEFFRGKVFPEYFYGFLHEYMHMMTDVSRPAMWPNQTTTNTTHKNLGEPDERIDHVFNDLDKIMYFLNMGSAQPQPSDGPRCGQEHRRASRLGLDQFPVHLSVANRDHVVATDTMNLQDDGTLIFLNLVTSSMRNTARSASRIRACDLLLVFAERLTDEARLDRVLPYLVSLLTDDSDMVTMASLRSITQLVQMVKTITPINSHVFVEYIIPRIHAVLKGTPNKRPPATRLVRATYASCIGALAVTASRFLEMAATLQVKRTSGFSDADSEIESANEDDEAAFDELFDNAQRQLYGLFENHTKILIEDPDVYVRRAFLTSVPALCLFFGPVEANDILLTHLNTYLNDRDWMLKCAFFDTVVGISTLVGATALDQFILPLLMQALADPEEFVIQSAIHALAQLASLGLLSRPKIWELVDIISRCSMHPNLWIRQTAAEFMSAACRYLSYADVRCIILPMLQPYMKVYAAPQFNEIDLLDLLKKPLSRPVYDHAVMWASNAERSLFWKPFQSLRSLVLQAPLGPQAKGNNMPRTLAKIPRDDEDEQWVAKLRNLGMTAEDEFKLLALREFVWRFARTKARVLASAAVPSGTVSTVSGLSAANPKSSSLILLGSLGITPQTVFFDDTPKDGGSPTAEPAPKTTYTISDALMDASMTIDETAKRKKSGSGPSRSVSHTRMISRDESVAGPFTGSLRPPTRDNSDAASLTSNRRSLKFKPSALTLLDRRDGNKTVAETGTSDTTVFGQVEGPFVPSAPASAPDETGVLSAGQTQTQAQDVGIKVQHSYEGNDPNILKMLDAIFLQNYAYDMADFGPFVSPIGQRRNILVAGAPGTKWRPGNRLVAMFAEHTAAVNKVAVSPDHRFFVTASDDGTAKVWDTQRLERNISQRSRQTYHHAPGVRIVSLCFVEASYCFVTCADDGSVHVVKVDVTASLNVRYGRLKQLRRYQLPSGEFAVWSEHFKQENASVLVLATNRSRIVALDLRLMTELYVLENPVHHGMPTCFCIDRKRNWIAVGTSHGVIDLWDLRFRMRLKAWGVPGKSPIYRIGHHPTKGHGKWICVAGGTGLGEVTVWDIEKTLCREVYRIASSLPASTSTGMPREGSKNYTAWDVDHDKPEGMLGRFATNIEPPSSSHTPTTASVTDRGVRAMIVGTGVSQDGHEVKHAFIITGGSDKKLRFWDLALLENSLVYAGLGPDEPRPRFVASNPAPGVLVNTERAVRTATDGGSSGRRADAADAQSSNRHRTARPARNTVISQEQQHLLRSHLDCITDVALLELPYSISVSVDRSGVIYVFQ